MYVYVLCLVHSTLLDKSRALRLMQSRHLMYTYLISSGGAAAAFIRGFRARLSRFWFRLSLRAN